jgi:hypothetical protein
MRTPFNRRPSAFRGVLSSVAALAPLAVLTAAVCSVTGCGGPQAAPAIPSPEVEVASVVQKDVPIVSEWVATLDGYVNAQIQPQVAGYVIRQTYKEPGIGRGMATIARTRLFLVRSLIPVRVDRQGSERMCWTTNRSGTQRSPQNWGLFVFLVTSDQHSQEQDKHQDTEQDSERLPDVFLRSWRIMLSLLCLRATT